MSVEFATFKPTLLIQEDYININGKWFEYKEVESRTLDKIFMDLIKIDRIRIYARDIQKRGVTERIEQVRHIARRFFPKCDRTPDIDDNGSINIEVQ